MREGVQIFKTAMAEKSQLQTVKIVYVCDPAYSTKYIDGATASVMPSGHIHVSFFLERAPYLKELVHELTPEGTLGTEVSRTMEFDAICRLQQTGIVLTAAAAENLIVLLQGTLKQVTEVQEHAKAAKEKR